MRLPRFANPLARRVRLDRLDAADLPGLARNPSYRAPSAADVLDPARAELPEPPRMSEAERRLLDAVLADPDADAPRLAYAHWAERQGDTPRAELIREQVKTARGGTRTPARITADQTPDRDPDPRSSALKSAFIRVLSSFCAAQDLVVRRGFVEGMSLSGRSFVSLGDILLWLAPLREVRLVAVRPFVGELARCPHLGKLRRLDLAGNRIGPVGVRELAGSGLLGGLRELGLDANDLGPDGLAALLAAAWVPGLAAVELADNRLGPAEARAVAAAAWPNLVALDLSRNPLGTDGTEGLAKAGFLPRLRRLAVSRCGLGPVGAGALFAGRLGSLTELDISVNGIGPDGAAALAEDGSLSKLAALDLEFNDIESAGAEAVATSEALGAIVSLNLAGNRITAAGAEALAESDVLGSVEELDLTTNPIGDGGAVALVRGEALASLSRLSLANCGITDAGVKALTATGALGGLRSLSLAWNPLGDAGVKALAACPDLAGLHELDLTGTRIGLAATVALAGSENLADLRTLTLGENHRLPADAVALLAERFPTTTNSTPVTR